MALNHSPQLEEIVESQLKIIFEGEFSQLIFLRDFCERKRIILLFSGEIKKVFFVCLHF